MTLTDENGLIILLPLPTNHSRESNEEMASLAYITTPSPLARTLLAQLHGGALPPLVSAALGGSSNVTTNVTIEGECQLLPATSASPRW